MPGCVIVFRSSFHKNRFAFGRATAEASLFLWELETGIGLIPLRQEATAGQVADLLCLFLFGMVAPWAMVRP